MLRCESPESTSSISDTDAARHTWRRTPIVLADRDTSAMSDSDVGFVGFASIAMSSALGTISLSNSICLAPSAPKNRLTPVRFPSGRFIVLTSPRRRAISTTYEHDWNVCGRLLCGECRDISTRRGKNIHFALNQLPSYRG